MTVKKIRSVYCHKNCFIHDNIKTIPLKNNTHEDHLCIYKDRNLHSKLILLLFFMSRSMYTILLFVIYNILLFLMSIFILKHIHNNTLLLLLMSINIYFFKVYFAHGILQAFSGVGCHFLLPGIFLTQGSSPCLLHCRQILYHLSQQGSPGCWRWGTKRSHGSGRSSLGVGEWEVRTSGFKMGLGVY